MNVKFAFLADAANLTNNGKLNVLGVFAAMAAAEFPCVHPHMALVISCEFVTADAGKTKTLSARLLTEDGHPLGEVVMAFTLPPPPVPAPRIGHFEIVELQNLVFPHEGTYEFSVEIDGHQAANVPLVIERRSVTDETAG